MIRFVIAALFLAFFVSSCTIEAVNQKGNSGNTDTTSVFVDFSKLNLPLDNLRGNSMDAKAADIDNDGDLDIILAIEFSSNKILINDGNGVFTDESDDRLPTKNMDSQAVAVADFNGDGSLDLIFVNQDDEVNEYYLNQGDGTFTDVSSRIPITGISNAVLATDINGDNAPDILIGNKKLNAILINDGNGYFSDQSASRLPQKNSITHDLELADFDNDGDRDLFIANEDDNRLFINVGNGFFVDRTETRLHLLSGIEETHDINLADVNNDGSLDLYFANALISQPGNSAQDRLLLNNQRGGFTDVTQNQLPTANTNTLDADFFDIDSDGDWDILRDNFGTLNQSSGNYSGDNLAQVWLNNGSGYFSNQTGAYFPQNFSPKVEEFVIADFNGDNLYDIYTANYQSEDVLLLRNE